MDPLLTLALGAELVVFLAVLLLALSRIRSALEKAADALAHVQWGVRAIETQTAPLAEQSRTLVTLAERVADEADALAGRLASAAGRRDVLPEPADRV